MVQSPFPRILCPLELRDDSERAVLRYALGLAAAIQTSVQALHVYSRGPEPDASIDLAEHLARPARERFEQALGLEPAAPASLVLLEGAPHERILFEAERLDVDYLVMGTHGRGAVRRFVLGSVAERVLRGATVPVIAVPYTKGAPSSVSSILVAHDLSSLASGRALELAAQLRLLFGAPQVTVVHVVAKGEDVDQRTWDAAQQLERDVRATFGPEGAAAVQVRVEDDRDGVRAHVLEVQRAVGADLTIVGRSMKSGVGRLALGSTASGLLARSEVPVCVVPSILKSG